MKFKDFQAPVLFSSTFKALNLGENNSSTFKDAWEPNVGRVQPIAGVFRQPQELGLASDALLAPWLLYAIAGGNVRLRDV